MKKFKRARGYRHRNEEATFELQLTAMADILSILLIFLIFSYSTSAVQLSPADKLELPASFSVSEPIEALKVVVADHGIYVDDKKIVELAEGKLSTKDVETGDPNFIKEFFGELDKQAQKSRDIASVNESLKFEGKVTMQIDKNLNYALIKKVLYTATLAGYNDVKLVAIDVR